MSGATATDGTAGPGTDTAEDGLLDALHEADTVYDVGALYDAIYHGRGKDYAAEAAAAAAIARTHRPAARDLLDVGCGTGGHLVHLAGEFAVTGIDLAEPMLTVARRRLPTVTLHRADLRRFDLGRRFDVVTCLFSVIGNVADRAELDAGLTCLATHLHPGGVLVLEPWWFAEDFTPGHVGADVVTHDGTTVARVSHSTRDERASHMQVHYVLARPDQGIRHFHDEHRMTLFSRAEYGAALHDAGLDVVDGPADGLGNGGPGLIVALRRPDGRPS